MSDKQKGYLGNPNLKETGLEMSFTKAQVKEYMKCAGDPIYFTKKYIKVVSLDKGLIPFDLYDYQKDIVETVHNNRFVICKLPRQSGKSTTVVAYILHYILFNQDMTVGILANKQSTARELLHRLKLAYEVAARYCRMEQRFHSVGERLSDHRIVNIIECDSGWFVQHDLP